MGSEIVLGIHKKQIFFILLLENYKHKKNNINVNKEQKCAGAPGNIRCLKGIKYYKVIKIYFN